jgi:large subunit ribosomal protein L10
MTREEKTAMIEDLKQKIDQSPFFYITDSSTLSVEKINKLRRICFDKGVEIRVVKNTLARKAMESLSSERNYDQLFEALSGPTTLMFAESANLPAKLIEEFRKKFDRPIVKAAYIDTDVFIGDENLEMLAKLKSKEELLGELIGLLQSPAKNVVSALKSGGSTIAGLVKALEERNAQ